MELTKGDSVPFVIEKKEEVEEEEEEEEVEEEEGGETALGAVVKEGWLTKKGEVRKNWLKRWFVLKYGSLAYFKTQGYF